MSKRRKKPRSNRKLPQADTESRQAHLLTIVWTLSVTTTFLCDIGAAVTRLWTGVEPQAAGAEILSGMLLFAASVAGLLVLVLMPVVLKMRRQAPPRGYVVFAALVAVAPLLAVALQIAR